MYLYSSRAVVNLEGAGSGSREVLFQSGPNHSWLVDVSKFIDNHYPFTNLISIFIFS